MVSALIEFSTKHDSTEEGLYDYEFQWWRWPWNRKFKEGVIKEVMLDLILKEALSIHHKVSKGAYCPKEKTASVMLS